MITHIFLEHVLYVSHQANYKSMEQIERREDEENGNIGCFVAAWIASLFNLTCESGSSIKVRYNPLRRKEVNDGDKPLEARETRRDAFQEAIFFQCLQ